jgi:simple sugar transport system substrate-binding protein
VKEGNWKQQWLWLDPDWQDINNTQTSAIGFVKGPALAKATAKALDSFIADLGAAKINLFKGPLNYQDGSVFIKAGEVAGDKQIWYMEQLLEGMLGSSSAK